MTPTPTPPGTPSHQASGVARFLPDAVTQPVAVQPLPQTMEEAVAVRPGDFQSALNHVPVESSLTQLKASVVQAHTDVPEHEAPGPVIFHTSPQKAEGKSQPSTTLAQTDKAQPPAGQAMTPQAGGATSTTTRSSPSGCCDDPATTYIIWNDDGSCAAAINGCATGVLRSCQALARLPGAVRDCLPSSQSLHNGCDRLVSAAGQCCESFGNCLAGSLGLCKDIICCPCTTCGQLCDACCKGLEGVDCCCCCPSDADCCCCCTDCDCSGCDCNC